MKQKKCLPLSLLVALGVCLASSTDILYAADESAGFGLNKSGEASASNSPKSDDAQTILKRANETMSRYTTMKAVLLPPLGKTGSSSITCKRKNPDGTMDTRLQTESSRVYITNRDGSWLLTPTIAIKRDYKEVLLMKTQQMMAGANNEAMMPATLSLSGTTLKGEPYWVVKAATSEATIQQIQQLFAGNKAINQELHSFSVKTMPIPAITEYLIGKKDNIIYSTRQYDEKGNKISDTTYDSLQFNIPLADDNFSIPKNLSVKVAKTLTEYVQLLAEINRKTK